MENLNLPEGTVRASLAAYTTEQEIDLLIAAVGEINRGSRAPLTIPFSYERKEIIGRQS
ncbi:hypothetical protein [Methanoculleus bourgensis]|uniref:Uncharacterized protein n=1 Tax=Methanoculleus bourgensis TaxID=83986 RepID=A0A0X3BN49_9EURY|nr:protein of unknown function [Methanoculleus bourgensis]